MYEAFVEVNTIYSSYILHCAYEFSAGVVRLRHVAVHEGLLLDVMHDIERRGTYFIRKQILKLHESGAVQ